MIREISITIDDTQYEYFESIIEETKFDNVEEYLARLIAEYHTYHSLEKDTDEAGSSTDRDLDSHLEALGYK